MLIIEIDNPAPKFSTYSLRNLKFFCDDPKRNEKSEFERVFAIGPFSLKSMYQPKRYQKSTNDLEGEIHC